MRSFRFAVVTATVTVLPEPPVLVDPPGSEAAFAARYSTEQYPVVPEAVRTCTHPFEGAASSVTMVPFGIVVKIDAPVPAEERRFR